MDFSDDMLVEMYNWESWGDQISPTNGFAVGKKWMDVTIKMWKQDIKDHILFKKELYDDPKFPHWWLDSVLKK